MPLLLRGREKGKELLFSPRLASPSYAYAGRADNGEGSQCGIRRKHSSGALSCKPAVMTPIRIVRSRPLEDPIPESEISLTEFVYSDFAAPRRRPRLRDARSPPPVSSACSPVNISHPQTPTPRDTNPAEPSSRPLPWSRKGSIWAPFAHNLDLNFSTEFYPDGLSDWPCDTPGSFNDTSVRSLRGSSRTSRELPEAEPGRGNAGDDDTSGFSSGDTDPADETYDSLGMMVPFFDSAGIRHIVPTRRIGFEASHVRSTMYTFDDIGGLDDIDTMTRRAGNVVAAEIVTTPNPTTASRKPSVASPPFLLAVWPPMNTSTHSLAVDRPRARDPAAARTLRSHSQEVYPRGFDSGRGRVGAQISPPGIDPGREPEPKPKLRPKSTLEPEPEQKQKPKLKSKSKAESEPKPEPEQRPDMLSPVAKPEPKQRPSTPESRRPKSILMRELRPESVAELLAEPAPRTDAAAPEEPRQRRRRRLCVRIPSYLVIDYGFSPSMTPPLTSSSSAFVLPPYSGGNSGSEHRTPPR